MKCQIGIQVLLDLKEKGKPLSRTLDKMAMFDMTGVPGEKGLYLTSEDLKALASTAASREKDGAGTPLIIDPIKMWHTVTWVLADSDPEKILEGVDDWNLLYLADACRNAVVGDPAYKMLSAVDHFYDCIGGQGFKERVLDIMQGALSSDFMDMDDGNTRSLVISTCREIVTLHEQIKNWKCFSAAYPPKFS